MTNLCMDRRLLSMKFRGSGKQTLASLAARPHIRLISEAAHFKIWSSKMRITGFPLTLFPYFQNYQINPSTSRASQGRKYSRCWNLNKSGDRNFNHRVKVERNSKDRQETFALFLLFEAVPLVHTRCAHELEEGPSQMHTVEAEQICGPK